jgi:hypothetical protein
MGINEIAVERILKLLIEEKAVIKLLKMIENERICDGRTVLAVATRKY